jgi:hypothetical protein
MDKKVYDKYLDIWTDTPPAKEIAELEKQLLEANAKIERLTGAILTTSLDVWDWSILMTNVVSETPAQSLKLHDADVIEQAVQEFQRLHYDMPVGMGIVNTVVDWFTCYASNIRNGVIKEGE